MSRNGGAKALPSVHDGNMGTDDGKPSQNIKLVKL